MPTSFERCCATSTPTWPTLDLRPVAFGWDNVVFRLGDELAVRLPRRQQGRAPGRARAALAARSSRPRCRCRSRPRCASVGRRWATRGRGASSRVDGRRRAGDGSRPPTRPRRRPALGGFLERAAPARRRPTHPANRVPGHPARRARRGVTRRAIATLAGVVDASRCCAPWEPPSRPPRRGTARPLWLHGDLHPANLLVRDGRIGGVIDFGDLTAGDPATDLIGGVDAPAAECPCHRDASARPAGAIDDDTLGDGPGAGRWPCTWPAWRARPTTR